MATGIRAHYSSPWDTHNTYEVFFFNDTIFTTVTTDPDRVSDWISDVKFNRYSLGLIVGLDVEWRPYFSAGNPSPVATLQLCVGDRCLIYQILHSPEIPPSLADFLSDNYNTFVGVGVKSDLEKLQSDYGIGGDSRHWDLGRLAADTCNRNDLRNAGLKALASFVLGKEVEKPSRVTMSAWDNRRLTAEQVQYACIDAFVSYEIGRVLIDTPYY